MSCSTLTLNLKKMTGFSLVELLVSLVLMLFLSTIIITVYVNTVTNYQQIRHEYRLISNMRYLSQLIPELIQSAGYFGCFKLMDEQYFQNPYEAQFSISNNNLVEINAAKDSIIIRRMSEKNVSLAETMQVKNELVLAQKNHYKPEGYLVISDCLHADIIKVNDISSLQITAEYDLSKFYLKHAIIGELIIEQLRVRENALYLYPLRGAPVEILQGVEQLLIDDSNFPHLKLQLLLSSGSLRRELRLNLHLRQYH